MATIIALLIFNAPLCRITGSVSPVNREDVPIVARIAIPYQKWHSALKR